MTLPALDTPVILRIPDRESIAGTVTYSGPGWMDVELQESPRTPIAFLERHALFLEYVDPTGLVRIMGHAGISPLSGRQVPPVLRFSHREVVQLLRRREHAGGAVQAAINLVRTDGDALAHGTKTIAIGASGFAVRDLPEAAAGQLYDFTIWPGGNEPPVMGSAEVEHVAEDGHVVFSYAMVAEFERERLARLLVGGRS